MARNADFRFPFASLELWAASGGVALKSQAAPGLQRSSWCLFCNDFVPPATLPPPSIPGYKAHPPPSNREPDVSRPHRSSSSFSSSASPSFLSPPSRWAAVGVAKAGVAAPAQKGGSGRAGSEGAKAAEERRRRRRHEGRAGAPTRARDGGLRQHRHLLAAARHAGLPARARRPLPLSAVLPADEHWTSEIVKVPQRKHIRRTVNGLDTSGPRYSPYPPSQAALKAGLLAIVRSPAKGILKDSDGTRARLHPDAMMNPPSAPYPAAAPSTLGHPQALQQGLGPHHPPPPPGMGHPGLQPPPPHAGNHMLQPPPPPGAGGGHGGRKMAEADAPPNVTVSTSTIPLSMAASLQQHPPPDLSAIVHQINQFCQARAGVSATSVCEGQIANPSPISRNLLISASSRVSAHQAPLPSCAQQANPGDPTLGAMHLASAAGRGPSAAYQSDMKQAVAAAAAAATWNQHQLAHLQRMCGEAVGPSGLMGKLAAGREVPGQAFPGAKGSSGYGLELCTGQPFGLKPPLEKPTPSPPVNGLPGPLPYTNGPYFQPLWNNILPTPNSDSSGSQDLAIPFHAATGQPPPPPMGPALECTGGPPPYRGGPGGAPPSQGGMMPSMEYLSGDLPTTCLREQGGGVLGKAPHRPSVNRGPESVMDSRSLHIQHPGYR